MSENPKPYDLIALGGGPAGLIAATTAAGAGKTVALVDNHHELGGAGVNTGTAPSKTLRETALALSGMRSRNLYGVDLSLRREATVADFLRHELDVKNGLNTMLAERLAASHVDVYHGNGAFEDAQTIRVRLSETQDQALLRGERILIATGSSPVHPPIFPFGSPEVYDSDTILELDRLPKTLAVVGAGTIGCEYACTFAALGTQVHVIEGHAALLPFLDCEISGALTAAMVRDGIVFHWNEQALACAAGGPEGVTLKLSSGISLNVDAVLVAAGRKSNTASLNLPAAGITPGERGLIHVNEHFQTEAEHIYAAGDVIGFPALASTGMEQARHAVRHAFGLEVRSEMARLLPTGIYTIPEIGTIGETEESLKSKGVEYIVGRAPYQASARGRIIGDSDGFLKLLIGRGDMKLLGVHALGEQATELVHVGMIAMLAGCTTEIFEDACFNIPTLGVLYKVATYNAARASTT